MGYKVAKGKIYKEMTKATLENVCADGTTSGVIENISAENSIYRAGEDRDAASKAANVLITSNLARGTIFKARIRGAVPVSKIKDRKAEIANGEAAKQHTAFIYTIAVHILMGKISENSIALAPIRKGGNILL